MSKNDKSKKTESVHLRLSEKIKVLVTEEATKNVRTFQDEVVVLLAEALHHRRFHIKDYT